MMTEQSPTAIGTEKVTVLEVLFGRAAKTFTPKKTTAYQTGKTFNVEERAINGLNDLYNLINDLRWDPQRFIIRGRPTGPQRHSVMRRLKGEDATFADEPLRWACVDVDSVGASAGTPREQLAALVASCPQLSGTACVVQLSSSWGIKPGIRAHLWYWLTEPRTGRQVSEWAASLPFRVDHSLFMAIQPHYTADPEFKGVDDPLEGEERVILLPGADELYIPSGQAESEVQYWVDQISNIPEDEPRHHLINKAAFFLGGWVGAGVYAAEEIEDILINACEDSGVFESERIEAARGEIKRAIADGAKAPRNHEDWRSAMIRTEKGAIKPLPENIVTLFKLHQVLRGVFGYDLRTQQTMILKKPPWPDSGIYPRTITDNDDTEATAWTNRVGIHTSSVPLVSSALTSAAADSPYDGVVDWLDGLPQWDRCERIDHWLLQAVGCPDTQYHRAVSTKFLISLVARALRPGCKVDDMLVLVGRQGTLKSTLLCEVVSGPGDWAFSDCLGDIHNPKEYVTSMMGPWLIEVAELASFNKREVEAVKKFLSTSKDRFRMPYARRAIEIPRRGVVAGTSNNSAFLLDATGNRRFWPVDTEEINLGPLRRDREQLFAEAIYRFKEGATWHLEGSEALEAMEEQERHRNYDPWEELIINYVDGAEGVQDLATMTRYEVTLTEIIDNVLRLPPGQAHHGVNARVGTIMRLLGWEKSRISRKGHRTCLYRRPLAEREEL